MQFRKITIVGVGLLGGSLGLAARRRRLAREVAGYVRRPASVKECTRAGAVDFATTDLLAAVWNADLILLCTPVGQLRELTRQMLPALRHGAIVTDVGSVKGSVVREIEPLVAAAGAHFVGSHPMAGAEKMGVGAARADLFVDAACVVTPTARTNPAAARRVERFWRAVGCRLLRLSPETHDRLVSRSSHLPHLVAATLANLVLNTTSPGAQAALCASGFRDTTRIASGSPEMWRDIALSNRRHLSRTMTAFINRLEAFQRSLDRADAPAIRRFYEKAKRHRDQWAAGGVSPSPE